MSTQKPRILDKQSTIPPSALPRYLPEHWPEHARCTLSLLAARPDLQTAILDHQGCVLLFPTTAILYHPDHTALPARLDLPHPNPYNPTAALLRVALSSGTLACLNLLRPDRATRTQPPDTGTTQKELRPP